MSAPSTVDGDGDSVADVVVDVVGLTKSFPGPPPVTALAPCTFQIRRGEYVAVTGASGSGKTTLLSLLGLLDRPSGGQYRLNGLDVADHDDAQRSAVRAQRIGFVFQAFHLLGYRTVTDNVELGLLYQGVPKRQRRAQAVVVIDQVGLGHRRHALCSTLSGGEKQRVAIARALVREPTLVLCDEPTGNLDSHTADQVLGLIDSLHHRGMTVIVITHDPDTARRAQRNLVITDGTLTETTAVRR